MTFLDINSLYLYGFIDTSQRLYSTIIDSLHIFNCSKSSLFEDYYGFVKLIGIRVVVTVIDRIGHVVRVSFRVIACVRASVLVSGLVM